MYISLIFNLRINFTPKMLLKMKKKEITFLNTIMIFGIYYINTFILLLVLMVFGFFFPNILNLKTLWDPVTITFKFFEIFSNIIQFSLIVMFCRIFFSQRDLEIVAAWRKCRSLDIFFSILLAMAAFFLLTLLSFVFNSQFSISKSSSYYFDIIRLQTTSIYVILFLNIINFGISTLTEEMLMRGLIFGSASKTFGFFGGAFISTLFFYLIHIPLSFDGSLLTYLVFSLIAIYIRLRSKSILGAFIFHFCLNMFFLIYILYVNQFHSFS